MTWISTRISSVLHCSGTPSESWWDVMRTAYRDYRDWRRYWKWAFSVSDTIILSYTFIYVHIRAYTCTYMLFTLSRFLPTSPTHTCIYMHILAYTCIYWHILAYTGRRGGGDSEKGMHWHPLPVAFESESVAVFARLSESGWQLPPAGAGSPTRSRPTWSGMGQPVPRTRLEREQSSHLNLKESSCRLSSCQWVWPRRHPSLRGLSLRRFKFDSGAVRPGSDSGLQ